VLRIAQQTIWVLTVCAKHATLNAKAAQSDATNVSPAQWDTTNLAQLVSKHVTLTCLLITAPISASNAHKNAKLAAAFPSALPVPIPRPYLLMEFVTTVHIPAVPVVVLLPPVPHVLQDSI